MLKKVCKRCHEHYGLDWSDLDDKMWEDDHQMERCPSERFHDQSLPLHFRTRTLTWSSQHNDPLHLNPPDDCLYVLEHLVMEQETP